jgi:hypothetical protein
VHVSDAVYNRLITKIGCCDPDLVPLEYARSGGLPLNRRPKRGHAKKMVADGGPAFDSSCSP